MVRVRFAPSPTGSLHLGAARTAVVNWLFARSQGGELVLRIDDTDAERSEADLQQEILNDLEWLGIEWDRGPILQSQQLYVDAYRELENGDDVYLKDGALWFRVPDRTLGFDDLIRGRIEIPAGAAKDFVIRRSDGSPTYNFATAIDDVELGITQVLRGEDHISNTHLQILVIEAIGKSPPEYGHLPLLLGSDGGKLSKRHGAQSVDEYRQGGYLPEALVNYLATVSASYGEKEVATTEELIQGFSLERVHKSAAKFDPEKLLWINGQHIRRLSDEDFKQRIHPFIGHEPGSAEAEALQTSAATLKECAEASSLFNQAHEPDSEADKALHADGASVALEALSARLPDSGIGPDEAKELLADVRRQLKDSGIAPKVSMKAVRAALTGRTSGPELHYFLAALDPDELRRRLAQSIS